MTTINPNTGSGSDRLNPTIQTTLNRLGRALTIRGGSGEGAAKAGDSVQISPAAASASRATTSIADIGALLANLETLVAQAAQDNAGADVRAEAQRRIDEAVAMISQIAGSGSVGEVGRQLETTPRNTITNQIDGISNVRTGEGLARGEALDIELLVTEIEQPGGFFLSFGGATIDLGTGSSFVFEVGGSLGIQRYSFASGTSVADIANAITSFESETGVQAQIISNAGIRISGVDSGSDSFVSLRVVDDGSITGARGVFQIDENNPDKPVRASGIRFNSSTLANGVVDFGADTVAFLNSAPALVIDNNYSASLLGGVFEVSFDLDLVLGTDRDEFRPDVARRVFTVTGGLGGASYTSDRNELIGSIRVDNQSLGLGESFDVDLVITGAAERAGVAMSLTPNFNDQSLVSGSGAFRISGDLGSTDIVFEEGLSYQDYADRINAQTEFTGVRAQVSGFTIRVESLEFGDDQLVTVQTLETSGLSGYLGGLRATDSGGAMISYQFNINSEIATVNGVWDSGRSLRATADDFDLSVEGRRIIGEAFGGSLQFEFEFVFNPDSTGSNSFATPVELVGTPFRAFTIHGGESAGAKGPIDDAPLGGPSPVSQALNPFTTTGANAGDFVAALDAVKRLREQYAGSTGRPGNATPLDRRGVFIAAGQLFAEAAPVTGSVLDLLEGAGGNVNRLKNDVQQGPQQQ